ncbi:MAG TPA: glycosyltransferase family 9 protein [Gemmatimonadaceae bacterium]|nr:glycosyltransferase family 9 protein [Gemmatimonadaceae bacterium]
MRVQMQRKVDNYVGRLGIAVLRPAAMLLGAILRRNHDLTVQREVVWVKMLGGGSLLIAMPMLLGFRRARPNVRMVLITTPAVRPFAELLGVFDEIRIIDDRSAASILWSSARVLLQTFRAECIVDLEVHSRLTTVFTTLTMARNRVSFWLEDIFWRRGLASHLVFFNRSSGSYHFYDRIGDLFGTPIATRAECESALRAAAGIDASTPVVSGQVCVGFACSDLAHERMLSPAHWLEVFRTNVRPEHTSVLLLGGPRDRALADEIIATLAPAFPALRFRNVCGERSLAGSAALVCESPEFWGIDSGLLHIARIAGRRCVSYWGPTAPSTLLRDSWQLDETMHYRKIACSPCVHTSEEAPCRGDNRCIQGLFDPTAAPVNWTPMEHPPVRQGRRASLRDALSVAWRNLGFICVAAVLVYCVVHAFDPPRLNWGDSASDYNAMTAGRNFQKYGFLKLRFTPYVLDLDEMTPADTWARYTHYPQLPDVMNGVERVVFGFSTLTQFRFVALGFSFCALFFVYQLLRAYWSRDTAQFALALWVVNPLWIQHADYLHHAPYAAFFGFGAMYFLVRYLREQRRGFLVASGVFVYFTMMSSYDFWFFAPLLIAAITFAHYRRLGAPAIKVLGILAGCAALALATKWSTNAWALGGVHAWLQDLRYQAIERGTDAAVKVAYEQGLWTTLVGRVERCFSLLLFPVAAFWALLPILRRRVASLRSAADAAANPIVVLIAALPFLALFSELWVGQYYPTLLVLPFYAVASAALAVLLMQSGHRLARTGGIVLVGALMANSISEDATFKKAFFDPKAIQALKADLDSVSVPGQKILVDHVFDAAYRYYTGRNTVALILNPPAAFPSAVNYYTDVRRPRVAPPSGAIYVQHKHLADEMYDKGYYYILGRAGLWGPWANPERYHADLDRFIDARDSLLTATVASVGEKIYDNDFFAIWRIKPEPGGAIAMRDSTAKGSVVAAAKHETHLAKVEP